MKISKNLTLIAIALALSTNNFVIQKAMAKSSTNVNIALVDIQKIVENSPSINALNVYRKNKLDDLVKFIENANADVAKETNATKKKTLEDGYNKELNIRKEAIDKEYAQKLSEIDKNITVSIKTKAKECNYDLVLTKSNVLDGGTDITSEIIKGLK